MSSKISSAYLVDFILERMGVLVELQPDLEFYHFIDEEFDLEHIVLWTMGEDSNYELIFSKGIEVARKRKNTWRLTPAILEFLIPDQTLNLTSFPLLNDVTKGKSISPNILSKYNNGDLMITHHKTKIAYGSILEGIFTPLLDLGWYLREGE